MDTLRATALKAIPPWTKLNDKQKFVVDAISSTIYEPESLRIQDEIYKLNSQLLECRLFESMKFVEDDTSKDIMDNIWDLYTDIYHDFFYGLDEFSEEKLYLDELRHTFPVPNPISRTKANLTTFVKPLYTWILMHTTPPMLQEHMDELAGELDVYVETSQEKKRMAKVRENAKKARDLIKKRRELMRELIKVEDVIIVSKALTMEPVPLDEIDIEDLVDI